MIQKKNKIPEFKSREEEAEFWDIHDFSEFWDEFKPVEVRFAKNLSEGITIRLDPKSLGEVRKEAAQKGIGPTTLIRMWVMEHLQAKHQKQT